MTFEDSDPNPNSDHILDWLEDSVSFLPSFFDDPYNCSAINDGQWWEQGQDICNDLINASANSINSTTTTTANSTTAIPTNPTISNQLLLYDSSKKRKNFDDPSSKTSQNHHNSRKNQVRKIDAGDGAGAGSVEEVMTTKKSGGNKKNAAKGSGNNGNNGNNKEGRWAEQLLNPCAAAITAGNLTRVQHLLYVLHELASLTGDANHRLAAHGLRALTHHLSSSTSSSTSAAAAAITPVTFASTEPRFFQRSLLKFYEISPWFAFPNNIANSSILQFLAGESDNSRNLHIIDIGVSHGVQWPTLFEALTRRAGGPPPLLRLTVVAAPIENDLNSETPFSIGPPGDNFSSRLLVFAKSMNLNLQINRIVDQKLQNLNTQILKTSPDESLLVCAQFRLNHLNHNNPDEKTEFLKFIRDLNPKGVILSENNMECSCNSCGDFAMGFSQRLDFLWRFLDSTSSAFKGRETEERRVMEGEAAKGLISRNQMNEGKEKWCERMRGLGFVGEGFGEDVVDGGRALLRKYDSNWEMKVEEKDGCVGLWWKGQPVSFCSLWKLLDSKVIGS